MQDTRSHPPVEARQSTLSTKTKAGQFFAKKLATVRDRFTSSKAKDRPVGPYLTTSMMGASPKPFMSQPMLSLYPRPSVDNDGSSSSQATRGSMDTDPSRFTNHIPQKLRPDASAPHLPKHRKSPSAPLQSTPMFHTSRTPAPQIIVSEVDVSAGGPKIQYVNEGQLDYEGLPHVLTPGWAPSFALPTPQQTPPNGNFPHTTTSSAYRPIASDTPRVLTPGWAPSFSQPTTDQRLFPSQFSSTTTIQRYSPLDTPRAQPSPHSLISEIDEGIRRHVDSVQWAHTQDGGTHDRTTDSRGLTDSGVRTADPFVTGAREKKTDHRSSSRQPEESRGSHPVSFSRASVIAQLDVSELAHRMSAPVAEFSPETPTPQVPHALPHEATSIGSSAKSRDTRPPTDALDNNADTASSLRFSLLEVVKKSDEQAPGASSSPRVLAEDSSLSPKSDLLTEEPEEDGSSQISAFRPPSPLDFSVLTRSFTTPASPASPPSGAPQPSELSTISLPSSTIRHRSSTTSPRTDVPHLGSLPRFQIPGAPARFSPAIITRQPPHPIFTLPPISPSSSNAPQLPRPRPQSLRSMPSLLMEGADKQEADHESLDDLDEEDEDGTEEGGEDREDGNSDDEAEDGMDSTRPSVSSSAPHAGLALPDIQTSRLDTSFLDTYLRGEDSGSSWTSGSDASQNQYHTADDRTPSTFRPADYFSSKAPERSPIQTPRANELGLLPISGLPQPRIVPMPMPNSPTARPPLYHHASKSMVDMTLTAKERSPELKKRESRSIAAGLGVELPSSKQASGPSPSTMLPPQDNLLGASLRRQRSMPTFTPSSSPPPYPDFPPPRPDAPPIMPRDEEGRERLPAYSNDIYLRAILPRKMEFSAPGVQARDRKWRRTLCVLEGTAFRVYRCPPAAVGVGVIGEWWEKTVGVGDIAEAPATASVANAQKAREREQLAQSLAKVDTPNAAVITPTAAPEEPPPPAEAAPPPVQQQPLAGRSRLNLLRPGGSSSPTRSRFSSDTSRDSSSSRRPLSNSRSGSHGATQSLGAISSGASSSAVTLESSSASTSQSRSRSRAPRGARSDSAEVRGLWREDPGAPLPSPKDLIKEYRLSNAESGLGTDYTKRRNVIRIRMEGEQFLLQAADVAGVVDWIEGFQAAANIALDLDERPMPKGPMFPRRRRRRARRAESSQPETS